MFSSKNQAILETLFLRIDTVRVSAQSDEVSLGLVSARVGGESAIGRISKRDHVEMTTGELLELAFQKALGNLVPDWKQKMATIFASGELKTVTFL